MLYVFYHIYSWYDITGKLILRYIAYFVCTTRNISCTLDLIIFLHTVCMPTSKEKTV